MGNVPSGYELKESDAKQCVLLTRISADWIALRDDNIIVSFAEMVVHIQPKLLNPPYQPQFHNKIKITLPPPQDVKRIFRVAVLTDSMFYLSVKDSFFGKACGSCMPTVVNYDDAARVEIAFGEFTHLHYDPERQVVILGSAQQQEQRKKEQWTIYQTPDIQRMLLPLLHEIQKGYVGVPIWAIPIKWYLPFQVPKLTHSQITQFYGNDGGFSTIFFYKANAVLARQPNRRTSMKNPSIQSKLSATTDQKYFGKTPLVIDAAVFDDNVEFQFAMLDCLPFNLTFRVLKVKGIQRIRQSDSTLTLSDLHSCLSRVVMYNVTLRELDLSGTSLAGAGEMLGQAFATNIQPLISRLNLSACQISNRDFRAMIPGLARLWCCGSVDPVSFDISYNQYISNASFQFFWKVLVDPHTLFCWPSTTPPPANTKFWQHLGLRETQAHGAGLSTLLAKMTGLTSISLGPRIDHDDTGLDITMAALETSSAPLEIFRGEGMADSCLVTLFNHRKTLKKVHLISFGGSLSKLLTGWPDAAPKLALELEGNFSKPLATSDQAGFVPGSLRVLTPSLNHLITSILTNHATGLKELYLDDIFHSVMADIAPILATCGLEVLHLKMSPSQKLRPSESTQNNSGSFWTNLAISTTLRDLQVQNQLNETGLKDGLSLVGKFLKTNRSVRSIGFDGSFSLELESVKVLRSAFYGNKKVTSMQYPKLAQEAASKRYKAACRKCINEVSACKREIKRLFQSAYSKYNRNWRDRPNREKIPYVNRIREAKRKMSRLGREMKKIGTLFEEIQQKIVSNRSEFNAIQSVKTAAKMDRKADTFSRIAQKKVKTMGNIVTKLHKAKVRGRKDKAAKQQIPRAAYYKDRSLWPTRNPNTMNRNSSYWTRYNDPYDTRYPYWSGFYGYHHHVCYHHHVYHNQQHWQQRDEYLDDDNYTPPNDETGTGTEVDPYGSAIEVEPDISVEPPDTSVESSLPPSIIDPNHDVDGANANTRDCWDGVTSDPIMDEQAAMDPWNSMDTLVSTNLTTVDIASILPNLHDEAAELGPDVLADIAPMLDQVAALDSSVEQTAEAVGVDKDIIDSAVDSHVMNSGFDVDTLQTSLGDTGDYIGDDDDIVDMYGAAGPRDLDDGGPSFGDDSIAVLARTQYRRRLRKNKRAMIKVRKSLVETCPFLGYRRSIFPPNGKPDKNTGICEPWPDSLQRSWDGIVQETEIDVIAKSAGLFTFPEVSKPEEVVAWNQDSAGEHSFVVTLVTQCSVDRLTNLEEQLSSWKGSASVALYVRDGEDKEEATNLVRECVEKAYRRAQNTMDGSSKWDVTVNLLQNSIPDTAYPINLLRNVALLAAKERHSSLGISKNAAVFLVDVDFRPSDNLNLTLQSSYAADRIVREKKVIICPAFETKATIETPKTMSELMKQIESKEANGFHVAHFPQGHIPTDFTKHALISSQLDEANNPEECWKKAYQVRYSEGFEPYIVAEANSVPLYDERFQGYGLNKVSHLASVAQMTKGNFTVLPGVFISAPQHEPSDSWSSIYGSSSIDAKFNRLCLKGLYRNFCDRLRDRKEVMVSPRTQSWSKRLAPVEHGPLVPRTEPSEVSALLLESVASDKDNNLITLYACLLHELTSQQVATKVSVVTASSSSQFSKKTKRDGPNQEQNCGIV